MNNKWLTIKQLDKQLKAWQAVNSQYIRPRAGWVKTLRVALSMTTAQLGHRIGVKGGRISQLEMAEVEDAVTLHALRKVAEGLDCELVYAIVPKNHSTIDSIIKKQAEKVAVEKIKIIDHMMSLEAQSLSKEALADQKKDLIKELTENPNKHLWDQDIEVKGTS